MMNDDDDDYYDQDDDDNGMRQIENDGTIDESIQRIKIFYSFPDRKVKVENLRK